MLLVIFGTFADTERRIYLSGRSRVFFACLLFFGWVFFCVVFANAPKTSVFALYGVFAPLGVIIACFCLVVK